MQNTIHVFYQVNANPNLVYTYVNVKKTSVPQNHVEVRDDGVSTIHPNFRCVLLWDSLRETI